VLTLVGVLLLLAAGLALGSFLSYASVKTHLDAFASDGDAGLTHGRFDAIVVRARLAAVVVALVAIGVYVRRRRLGRFAGELGDSIAVSAGRLWRGLGRALAHESRWHLGALAGITLIAVLVRLEFLFQPMRYDESVTYIHYASRPWYIALTTYTAPNNHVFHSLLVHVSTTLFGGAPWAVRLPAFLAGVLLVPATYVAARAFYGKHAALVAAGLVASSSVLVEYSTNARGYTLVALCFVLLLALAMRLRTSWSLAEWLAFALLGAIGLFTVPTMLYGYGAVVLWLAVTSFTGERRLLLRRLVPSVLVTAAVSALLYAPLLAASGVGSLVHNEFVEPLSWDAFVDELPDSLWRTLERWHRDIPLPLAVALGVCFALGVVVHRRVSRQPVPPALTAVAFIAPVLVAQRVVPFERVWLFLVPLYLMTAAAGLGFLVRRLAPVGRREAAVATVVALVVAGSLAGAAVATQSVYDSEDTSTFRDGEAVADVLAARLRAGDKLLVAPPADAILEYQLLRRGLDAGAFLYWAAPGATKRFLAVVKEGPDDYPLSHLLADPRLDGARLRIARVVRRFDEATIYELVRVE
jgi:hypothetical protein